MTGAAHGELPSCIQARASSASAQIDNDLAAKLAAYLELLAYWNRKINLTALDLDPPTDEAIDRLVIESVVAAKQINPDEHLVLDVGSGGGSPALPLKLALPRLRFVLVESKVRKASFLREAARQLELSDVEIENRRLEALDRTELVDLVTIRAVRLDAELIGAIRQFLRPKGRVFFFGSTDAPTAVLEDPRSIPLVLERRSSLTIGY